MGVRLREALNTSVLHADVFDHDLQAGTMLRVSTNASGAQGNAVSDRMSLSADGRDVAFHSKATNLIDKDTNLITDMFLRDLQFAGETALCVTPPTDTTDPPPSDTGGSTTRTGGCGAFGMITVSLMLLGLSFLDRRSFG